MELLIFADGEFAKAVEDSDRTNAAFAHFERTLNGFGASVQHASGEAGSLVVDVPDEASEGFQNFIRADATLGSLISNVEKLQYQTRFNLSAEFTQAVRNNPADPVLKPLNDVLARYDANIKSQFDAFADFCRQAEEAGETESTLYKWTKATIEKPGKKELYASRFTAYADGGKEVYDKSFADGLEADLKALIPGGMVTKVNKFNTDPAQNPQAGPQFR